MQTIKPKYVYWTEYCDLEGLAKIFKSLLPSFYLQSKFNDVGPESKMQAVTMFEI